MAVQLFRQLLGDGINLRRMVDEVTTPAVERDLLNLAACGTGRHDGNKRQANQPGEVSFGYRGTAGGGLDNRGVFGDPAVTQTIQKQ
ncbi:hypothetical protein D3C75_1208040 [compost metagenome]